MTTPAESHEGGLTAREQIERYRTAFISVVTMIIIAAAVGGYILAHENLKLPGWVPVLGRSYFTLKADFQTAQAVTPTATPVWGYLFGSPSTDKTFFVYVTAGRSMGAKQYGQAGLSASVLVARTV